MGPENAIRMAVVMLQVTPIQTPGALANGTNRAKKNKMKMGTVSRFTVLVVTAVMLPGTYSINALAKTTITPIPIAKLLAKKTCFLSVSGLIPKRSR